MYFDNEMIINTKTHFYTDDFFELFYIENDFAKYFAKCCNLCKYSVSHTMIIFRNDTFSYYKTNQISLCCMILQNTFLTPE